MSEEVLSIVNRLFDTQELLDFNKEITVEQFKNAIFGAVIASVCRKDIAVTENEDQYAMELNKLPCIVGYDIVHALTTYYSTKNENDEKVNNYVLNNILRSSTKTEAFMRELIDNLTCTCHEEIESHMMVLPDTNSRSS